MCYPTSTRSPWGTAWCGRSGDGVNVRDVNRQRHVSAWGDALGSPLSRHVADGSAAAMPLV